MSELVFTWLKRALSRSEWRRSIFCIVRDFLLCDPKTVRPILGIELDDKSHQRADRQERDRFVDEVFAAAKLPLAHIPVKQGYPPEKLNQYLRQITKDLSESSNIIIDPVKEEDQTSALTCPKCGAEMIQRTANTGVNKGKVFWGCSNYPRCREIVNVTTQAK